MWIISKHFFTYTRYLDLTPQIMLNLKPYIHDLTSLIWQILTHKAASCTPSPVSTWQRFFRKTWFSSFIPALHANLSQSRDKRITKQTNTIHIYDSSLSRYWVIQQAHSVHLTLYNDVRVYSYDRCSILYMPFDIPLWSCWIKTCVPCSMPWLTVIIETCADVTAQRWQI